MSPDEIRFEVRRHLASRPTARLDLNSIVHGLARKGVEATSQQVTEALTFLMHLERPQVTGHINSINAKRYQITSAGVVAFENND